MNTNMEQNPNMSLEEFVERYQQLQQLNDTYGLMTLVDELQNPELSTNLKCNICFKKNINPNEIGKGLFQGIWKCSIEECGILTCHNCLRRIQEEEGETNFGSIGEGCIGEKYLCPFCRNYDWKYTMSGLLQYAIPQKALERTMSKELAYKIVRDRRIEKCVAEIERRESFNNLT